MWKEAKAKYPEFKSFAVLDSPCPFAVGGFRTLVNLLQGKTAKVKKKGLVSRIYVKFPFDIDDTNLDEVLAKKADKPDTYYLDVCPPPEEINSQFTEMAQK